MTEWYTTRIRKLLSAISHPSRAAILTLLARRDFGTNKSLRSHLRAIQEKSGGDSPSVVTHHVTLLEEAGLLAHSTDDPRIVTITALGRRVARAVRQIVSDTDRRETWGRSL